MDSVSDKQGITNPAAFIPFIASLSLPLGAAVITFAALVSVSILFGNIILLSTEMRVYQGHL